MTATASAGTTLSRARRTAPNRRAGLVTAVAGVAALLAGALFLPSAAAATVDRAPVVAASERPAVTPTPAEGAPTITSPEDGSFIGRASTTVTGTRSASQGIQVLSSAQSEPVCIRQPDGTTAWSCPVPLESSPALTLRVVNSGAAAESSQITLRVLTPPQVTGGALSTVASNGMVRGTGYPGASVSTELSNGDSCASQADRSGAWACLFEGMRTSGTYVVTARQATDFSAPAWSAVSAGMNLLFDLDRPEPPTLASPTGNSRVPTDGVTYAGMGEPGATVTVFADAYSLCTAPVAADRRWTCVGTGVPAGSYSVRTIQQDEAGNVGPSSAAVIIGYGPAPVAPPPSASGGPEAVPAPAPPVPAAEPTPAPVPDVASEPEPAHPEDSAPPPAAPDAAPPDRPQTQGSPNRDPDLALPSGPLSGGWNDPTQFAVAVIPPGAATGFPWWQAVLLALAALGLVAIPARLLAATITRARDGLVSRGARQIAGRNHARAEFETAPEVSVNRWLVAGAALAAAAGLVMLSGPITDQPAYLRLFIAVVLALGIVNAVGVLVPLWWGRRLLGADISATFLPRYLLLVGVTALGSRALGLEPALLFALLGSVALTQGTPTSVRGQLAAVRASTLVALALLGWVILGLLPSASGFLPALTAEVLNTVVLTALGSAVLVLIPVGTTSGRSILAWSPPVWGGLAVTTFAIMFGVLSPTMDAQGATLIGAAAGVFAAISVGAWAWQRYVSPSLS